MIQTYQQSSIILYVYKNMFTNSYCNWIFDHVVYTLVQIKNYNVLHTRFVDIEHFPKS